MWVTTGLIGVGCGLLQSVLLVEVWLLPHWVTRLSAAVRLRLCIKEVAMSLARGIPQKLQDELQAVMASHVRPDNLPGLLYAVCRDGETILNTIGYVDKEGSAPLREDTIFRIASLTKPIVGVAAMMLVEEGVFSLDDPIDAFLPELANRRVLKRLDGPISEIEPATRSITVDDLLTCRMGFGLLLPFDAYPINMTLAEMGFGMSILPPEAASTDDWIAAFSELPLMRQPGTVWLYGTSILVLGALIERASGKSLAGFCQDRIFDPLGMVDSGFCVPAEKLDRFPPVYWRNVVTGAVEVLDPGGVESWFAREPGFASADGGLVSTASDYLTFARAMLHCGAFDGGRLISQASYNKMRTDHISPEQKTRSPFFAEGFWDTVGWGYAVAINTAQTPADPQGVGWEGGYGLTCAWDHETGTIGLLMTQRMIEGWVTPHFQDFWRVVAAIRSLPQ